MNLAISSLSDLEDPIEAVSSLIEAIEEVVDADIDLNIDGNDFEIDTDGLLFTFSIEDDEFILLNLEILNPGQRIGSNLMIEIKRFCSTFNLSIFANKVIPEAESWWKQQGFYPDPTENRWYLAS